MPKDPSDDALRVYYEGLNTNEPFEVMRPQILDHIRQGRLDKAKAAYLKSLREQAKIAVRLPAPRYAVSLKDAPVRGATDSKVTIVEYGDYECPYCLQMQPTLDRVESEYKGKLAFAYKDVPLPMHSHAQKAAEAAHCAGVQGKFWEYHDLLFAKSQLDLPQLKEKARSLNLDPKAFDECLDSGAQAALVKTQLAEAQAFQLQGTPSFFINGRFYSGGLSIEQFRAILEEELNTPKPSMPTATR